jgi:hypothetical protein
MSASSNTQTVFSDFTFIMAAIFVVTTIVALLHINDPSQQGKPGDVPPGNVSVVATWPAGDTDVDLWVFGPAEMAPVGYSNANGLVWNLLRDDLGTQPDATPLNMENAFARGVIPGRYTVNLHCFRCPQLPVPVDIEIRSNADGAGGKGGASKILVSTQVILTKQGQEKTAIDFKMDANAVIDDASMNNVFQNLRSKGK